MFRRIGAWCLCVCLCLSLCALSVAAETTAPASTSVTTAPAPAALTLLSEEAILADSTATYAFSPEGMLTVTATAPEAAIAIELKQEVDLQTMRYLQMSVAADVPFNIALKLSGEEYDLYPQLTGPSWYEAFQAEPPGENTGVKAGAYTMALDVLHYAQYNDLALHEDGTATVKTVYLTLYAPGTVTVSHLMLGETASFMTADGKSGTAATTLAPLTTHSDTTKLPTKYAYYDGGDIAALDDTVRQNEQSPVSMIVLIVIGVVLVLAMVLLTVLKKRRDKLSLDDLRDE